MRSRTIPMTALLAALFAGCASAPAPQPDPAAAVIETYWQCGDQRIAATFDNARDQARLSMGGGTLVLPHARSASGARYADARGNEFWTKGDSGTLTLAGQPAAECRQATAAGPWEQARARGAVFRGIGNEPGWWIEVGPGAAPALQAALDYGQRTLRVAGSTSFVDADARTTGYRGQTADGQRVELRIRDGECSDGMSDETYPATATLRVDGQEWQGCGRRLHQTREG